MSVVNEINAAISSLKGISRQRTDEKYYQALRELGQFDNRELDNEMAEAMRTIICIRRDLEKVRSER